MGKQLRNKDFAEKRSDKAARLSTLWKRVLTEVIRFIRCFKKPRRWKIQVKIETELGNIAEYENSNWEG